MTHSGRTQQNGGAGYSLRRLGLSKSASFLTVSYYFLIKIFFKDFNWSSVSDARHAALSGCLGNGCRNNVLDSRVKGCREDIIRVQFLVGDQRGNRAHGPESPWALFYMVKPEYSGSSAMGWAIPPNHGLAGAAAKPIHSATSTMAAPVITS